MKFTADHRYLIGLSVGALGIVYGDIGTSPLYALRECFYGIHAVEPNPSNILGVLSLIFWSLALIISVKYLGLVLRADNKGEGGILALLGLACPDDTQTNVRWLRTILLLLGVFGSALLYGDGMITPAISVLSAVEGLEVATPLFQPFIIPITVGILIALFSFQRIGTAKVANIFAPIMLLWFLCLAILGVCGIINAPEVLKAVNPLHGVNFFVHNGWTGFLVLGAVFLVVTGGEALYADMGHFGKRPIRIAWFTLVLPSLLLNYFGQGALLLHNPAVARNPFYHLAPGWALYPLVVLATAAAVIASQALISGAFSLTMHAIQSGYCPRLRIDHTSTRERGQIYIGHVNWMLMLACIGLVLGFQSSSHLAAAYGIAVTLTMIITTILFYFAARHLWGWSAVRTIFICLPFLLIEISFFGANAMKIFHGGWFPLVVGAAIFTLLTSWKTGRRVLWERLRRSSISYDLFLKDIEASGPARVAGTAIFLSGRTGAVPLALLHNLKHNKVLHERVIFLTVVSHEVPHVKPAKRLEVELIGRGFYRVVGNYGFMEEPDVPLLLKRCEQQGLKLDPMDVTYFLSKETIIPTRARGMALWRGKLFAVMARNAQSAATFFKLPPNRVVELGMQVEL